MVYDKQIPPLFWCSLEMTKAQGHTAPCAFYPKKISRLQLLSLCKYRKLYKRGG
jgi:hypothetical protein